MFQTARPDPALPKAEAYRDLLSQAEGLFHGETDAIANAANLSALIYHGAAGAELGRVLPAEG